MPEMQKQKGETADYFFSNDYFQQVLAPCGISAQSVPQVREAFLCFIVVYAHGEGFSGAHHHHQISASCYGGIDQVALEKDIVLGEDRDYHCRIFRTL
jgi:hypothetical protein